MVLKRLALLALLSSAGGCYEYHTVRVTDAPLDTRVRATVSATKAEDLAPVMREATPVITGRLLERTPDYLMLEVPIYDPTAGMSRETLHNRVRIGIDDLVSLQTRTLSKWKTGVAVGVIVAAASSTWLVLSSENETSNDKPSPDNALISIFKIPLALFGH